MANLGRIVWVDGEKVNVRGAIKREECGVWREEKSVVRNEAKSGTERLYCFGQALLHDTWKLESRVRPHFSYTLPVLVWEWVREVWSEEKGLEDSLLLRETQWGLQKGDASRMEKGWVWDLRWPIEVEDVREGGITDAWQFFTWSNSWMVESSLNIIGKNESIEVWVGK